MMSSESLRKIPAHFRIISRKYHYTSVPLIRVLNKEKKKDICKVFVTEEKIQKEIFFM